MSKRTNRSFRPMVEKLEDREVPSATRLVLTEVPVPHRDLFGGAQDVVFDRFTLQSPTKPYVHPVNVGLVPLPGSESLFENVLLGTLATYVDADHNPKTGLHGCERRMNGFVQFGAMGVLYLPFDNNVLVGPQATMCEARGNLWPDLIGDGTRLGADIAVVNAVELNGMPVSQESTAYRGVQPPLHTLHKEAVWFTEYHLNAGPKVKAGAQNVTLFEFGASTFAGAKAGMVTLAPMPGYDLGVAKNFKAVFHSWFPDDADVSVAGVVKNGKLFLNLGKAPPTSGFGYWSVQADAVSATVDKELQLGFYIDPASMTATDANGKALKGGLVVGYQDEGQVRVNGTHLVYPPKKVTPKAKVLSRLV